MRTARLLPDFVRLHQHQGASFGNDTPGVRESYQSIVQQMMSAENSFYDCDDALAKQELGLLNRDPVCPKPLTFSEDQRWLTWPWAIRRLIPRWMTGEYLALHGDPMVEQTPEHWTRGDTQIDWGVPGEEFNWTDGRAYRSIGANDINYNALVLGWCGINNIRNGYCKGIGLDIGAIIGAVFKAIAKVVSFIPGIGQIAGPILGGVGALASGENIGSAIIEAAANAIPGGGIAKEAVKRGAGFAQSMIEGKNVGDALLQEARAALVSQGVPQQALDAFDLGVALGTGKGLQQVGFKMLNMFVKGTDVYDRGSKFIDDVQKANVLGIPVEKFLTVNLGRELNNAVGPAVADRLNPILEQVATNPLLRKMESSELAKQLGVNEPVARAAQAIGRRGYVDEVLKEELLKSVFQRTWEKWGIATVTEGPLNMKYKDAVAAKRDELLKLAVVEDDSLKWKAQMDEQNGQFTSTASRVGRAKDTYVYDPGMRVLWTDTGNSIINADPNPAYRFHQAKIPTGEGKRFFAIALGSIAKGVETDRLRKSIYAGSGATSKEAQGFNTGIRIYQAMQAVHPDVRVQLAASGAQVASRDPIVMAARSQMRDAEMARGFDIAEGFLEGPPTAYQGTMSLEQVRDTLEPNPNSLRGFDTAVSMVRGRQQNALPPGINTPEAAAAFFATAGLAGLADKVAKANVAANFTNGQAREGAEAAIKAKSGFFASIARFFGLDSLFS